MSSHYTPLEVCEALVAPIEALSLLAGLHKKTAYAWRSASKTRDAGDISPRFARVFLNYSDERHLGLTARHLIMGAEAEEIQQILHSRRVAA